MQYRWLLVCALLAAAPVSGPAEEPADDPADDRADDPADDAADDRGQLIVYVRPASHRDLALGRHDVPALRLAVRRGVAFLHLGALDRAGVVEDVRRLGAELHGGFRELDLADRGTGGDALARLRLKLGKPPPVSDAEKKLLRRVGLPGAAKRPKVALDADLARPGSPLERALARPTRLLLVVDPSKEADEGDAIDGDADRDGGDGDDDGDDQREGRQRDRRLAQLIRSAFRAPTATGGTSPALRERTLFVLLFPRGGSPVLVVMGDRLKKGRIIRETLERADIVAALRQFLALPEGERGSADWLARSLIEVPGR